MKKCTKCGRDNLDDMRLCGYCGTRFPEEKTCGTFKKTLLTFYPLPEEVAVREVEKPKPVSDSDFTIEKNGYDYVLTKYNGAGGDVVIPDSVTSIGDWAFAFCSSLTSITIPNSVTSIGNYAFDACKSLTSITIPDSVTSIGNWAFRGCTSLISITIPGSVTRIGDYAFALCKSLTAINADINNPNYCSIDGVLYDKNQTMLIACPGGKESVTIPESVTSIGDYAFARCKSLRSITIHRSVTSIGKDAFFGCFKLVMNVFRASAGERYAKANGIQYKLIK